MENTVSIKKLIKDLNTSPFLLSCEIPMGYAAGLPVLQEKNGEPYLMFPFLRYQLTGTVDKTLVYPIHYSVTVRARDGKPVAYQDLDADGRFAKVDFSKPIGLFRHEAIRSWNKQTYKQNKEQLLSLYENACNAILQGRSQPQEEMEQMRYLLQTMAEPCQRPIYRALDGAFYEKYLA